MRRALLLAALLALALAVPGAANAYTLTPGSLHDRATVHALNVARDYWHAEPFCPQGISVTYFDGVALGDVWAAAYSHQPGCDMHLSRWMWVPLPAGFSDGYTGREELCMVVTHEWGHLLGFGHSPDPQSIMYASPEYLPPGCKAAHAARRHRHHRATSRRRSARGRSRPR